MGIEGKKFSKIPIDAFRASLSRREDQFPVHNLGLTILQNIMDYNRPYVYLITDGNSGFDALVPTTSFRHPAAAMRTRWDPSSKLDTQGLLAMGRRTTHIKFYYHTFRWMRSLMAGMLARKDYDSYNEQFIEPRYNDGFMAIEDYAYGRSEVSHADNGSLELPRTLPPVHHALLAVTSEREQRDLLGNSLTRELAQVQDHNWGTRLNSYIYKAMREIPDRDFR